MLEKLEERTLLSIMAGGSEADAAQPRWDAVPNEMLICFQPGATPRDMAEIYSDYGLSELGAMGRSFAESNAGVRLVATPPKLTDSQILALALDPRVEYVEPNYILSAETLPDDPRFDALWGLHNEGQTGGTPDADIDAPEAWNVATGSSQIVVGVIDTGIDYTHPDLYMNTWINQDEIPPSLRGVLSDVDGDGLFTFLDLNHAANAGYVADLNGTGFIDAADLLADPDWADGSDNDGNTYTDDLVGWDFVNNDNAPFDDNGHGTHVSGTIGGMGDNGTGVAGVNWTVQIMGLKFLDAFGYGSTFDAVRAVEYATMMGARLTNNSWGGGGFSTALADAIAASRDADMLFIAAAGNNSANNDFWPFYPASYDLDNIIAVAATDHNDRLAWFSNYGATSVDLGAPGVDILSTTPGNSYSSFQGTSMASPHVAGVAALALSAHPIATYEEIRDAILAGADPVPALSGVTVSGGRLNAAETLELVNPHRGSVELDAEAYAVPDLVQVTVFDADLDTNPGAPDTATVEMSSSTEAVAEVITLTETGPSTRTFVGTIALAFGSPLADGTLQVAHGDTITATYRDAEGGTGPVVVTDTAIVDAQGPVISQVSALPGATSARILWTTDEPSSSTVRYGTDPDNLDQTATDPAPATLHSVLLAGLTPETRYYFEVASTDAVGNTTADTGHSFVTPEAPRLLIETGVVQGVGSAAWTTVTLAGDYTSMVVVASPNYDRLSPAGVVRIRNASGNRFEVRVDSTNGSRIDGVSVHYLAVEEGVYTLAEDGITMEAVKFESTVTDENNSWVGENRGYLQSYSRPVVLGQVMSYNDPDWSVFWARGASRTDPPSSAALWVGKHVGEDPQANRAAETIGYVVVEAGSGSYQGIGYLAGLGADTVRGVGDAPPYTYPLDTLASASTAVVSQAGMDGGNGGWAVLYGPGPVTPSSLKLAIDEDQNDAERRHTGEQVAFLVFEEVGGAAPLLDLDEDDSSGATGSDYLATFVPGDGPVPITDADAVLTDPDSTSLVSLSVTITNLRDGAAEVLAADTSGTSITASYSPASGVLTLYGLDTIANYQQVLRTVTYDNTSPNPNTAARTITFVASDGDHQSNTATTTLTIPAANLPPVADAGGPYWIRAGWTLYLDGSLSYDPDGGPAPLTFAWDLDNDGTFGDVSGMNPSVGWATLEQYGFSMGTTNTIGLEVYDGEDRSVAYAEVTVAGNEPPVADAGGPYWIRAGWTLYLDGSLSYDPDGGPAPLTFAWDLDNDGSFGDVSGMNPSVGWATLEQYGFSMGTTNTIGLEVYDGEDRSVAYAEVTVAGNEPPVADAGGPYWIRAGWTLYLDASLSYDPDGGPSPLTFAWDLDNDGSFGDVSGMNPSVAWATLEQYGFTPGTTQTIAVEVSDGEDSSVATTQVTVAGNEVPVADAGGPYRVTVGSTVELDASLSYDPDGTIVSYEWDLDNDGQYDDAVGVTTTFSSGTPGTYTVGLLVTDDQGASGTDTATVTVDPLTAGPALRTGIIQARTDQWTPVTLDHTYQSMVVVLTLNYQSAAAPMVARVQNASGDTFEVKLDRADGGSTAITGIDVHYLVVEEGVYTLAEHGVKMEAVKFTSTVTDENASWVGEHRGYGQSYSRPVVLGQVMTYQDPDWSVFWARGSGRSSPPSSGALWVGKHVGEDPDASRAAETIGYVVIEAGSGTIGNVGYVAELGADSVLGMDNGPPFNYAINLPGAKVAIASQAAMDGVNGGWAVLYGANPLSDTRLSLAIDEDRLVDPERRHTTEQVAYIVFNPAASSGGQSLAHMGIRDLSALSALQPDQSSSPGTQASTSRTDEVSLAGPLSPWERARVRVLALGPFSSAEDPIAQPPRASSELDVRAVDAVFFLLWAPGRSPEASDTDGSHDDLAQGLLAELAAGLVDK